MSSTATPTTNVAKAAAAAKAAKAAETTVENAATTATTTTAQARGRDTTARGGRSNSAREAAIERHRQRSKSAVRKPKSAGSKLKGMVKSGWKSFKGSKSSSSVKSSSAASHASRDTTESTPAVLQTTATAAASEKLLDNSTTSSLELVVLLMDPTSRRFELLQLEFDSAKAKVSDLLTQIPLSVTEQCLQSLDYVGVLDGAGNLQEGSTRLLEAFGQNSGSVFTTHTQKMVLVAKPKGLSTKETMRLAKPILADTAVSKMVRTVLFCFVFECDILSLVVF